jgi:hypothetical protein
MKSGYVPEGAAGSRGTRYGHHTCYWSTTLQLQKAVLGCWSKRLSNFVAISTSYAGMLLERYDGEPPHVAIVGTGMASSSKSNQKHAPGGRVTLLVTI